MQLRKFFCSVFKGFIFSLGLIQAAPSIDYGTRFNVFQLIHSDKEWLWHSSFHAQIPSLNSTPTALSNFSTGIRTRPTPYFALGGHLSGGFQQQIRPNYLLTPGVEFWFPWVKLDMQAHLFYQKLAKNIDYSWVQTIYDLRLSVIRVPAVRLFFGVYYLDTQQNVSDKTTDGALNVNAGFEWLMSAQCSIESQYEFNRRLLFIRLKLHSPRVHSRAISSLAPYLREPLESYHFPIALLYREPHVSASPTASSTVSPLSIASEPEVVKKLPAALPLRRVNSDSSLSSSMRLQAKIRSEAPVRALNAFNASNFSASNEVFELPANSIRRTSVPFLHKPANQHTRSNPAVLLSRIPVSKPKPKLVTQTLPVDIPRLHKGQSSRSDNRNSLFSPRRLAGSSVPNPDSLPVHPEPTDFIRRP